MSTGQFVMAVSAIASLALYVGSAIGLTRKAKKFPLQHDEQQDDRCSQRRY